MSTTTETTTKAPEKVAEVLGISVEEVHARKETFLNNIKKP
jgi:hypothetical protein